jgi:hypothetical protein
MSKQWGTPTWLFFHTFAEQISDELYQQHAREICNIYVSICKNLPCGYCTKHATQYVGRTLNPHYIHNKTQLKQYLFDFHNSVNVRNGKPIFTDYQIYKNAKLDKIFEYFRREYTRSTSPYTGFQDIMHRKNMVDLIHKFLMSHKDKIHWV